MDSATRNYLRKRAHDLKPIVMIGKQGTDERIERALDEALMAHELVKVRFYSFLDDRQDLANALALAVKAEVVAMVGHIAIFFRQNENSTDHLIHIPKTVRVGEGHD